MIEGSTGAVTTAPTTTSSLGEQVTNADILEHAKRKCKLCSGTGLITKVHLHPGESNTYSKQICGCASMRFEKKMRDQIAARTETVTGRDGRARGQFLAWHWKVGSVGHAKAIIRRKLQELAKPSES